MSKNMSFTEDRNELLDLRKIFTQSKCWMNGTAIFRQMKSEISLCDQDPCSIMLTQTGEPDAIAPALFRMLFPLIVELQGDLGV